MFRKYMAREYIWHDYKRTWFGMRLFTEYSMDEHRFFIRKGILNVIEQETRLYRIRNINMRQSLLQRIFGLGTIHFDSDDTDLFCVDIKNVRHPEDTKELISNKVEEERAARGVVIHDMMGRRDSGHGGPEEYPQGEDGREQFRRPE